MEQRNTTPQELERGDDEFAWSELLETFDQLGVLDKVEETGKTGSGSIFAANAKLKPDLTSPDTPTFDRSPLKVTVPDPSSPQPAQGPQTSQVDRLDDTTASVALDSAMTQVVQSFDDLRAKSRTMPSLAETRAPASGSTSSAQWLASQGTRRTAPIETTQSTQTTQTTQTTQSTQSPLPNPPTAKWVKPTPTPRDATPGEAHDKPDDLSSSSIKSKSKHALSSLRTSLGKTRIPDSPFKKKHKRGEHAEPSVQDVPSTSAPTPTPTPTHGVTIGMLARARAQTLSTQSVAQSSFNNLLQVAERFKRVIRELFSERQVQTLERRVNDVKAAMSEHLIDHDSVIPTAYFSSRFEDAVMDLFITGYNVIYVTTRLDELAARLRPMVCRGVAQIEQALAEAGLGTSAIPFDRRRRIVLFDVVAGMQWAFLDLYPELMFKRLGHLIEQELKTQIKGFEQDLDDLFRANDKKGFAYFAMGICHPLTVKMVKVLDDTLFTAPSLKWEQAGPKERAEIENCLYQLLDAFEVPPLLAPLLRITREQVDARCKLLGVGTAERQERRDKACSKLVSAVMLKGLTPRFVTGLAVHTTLSTLLTKTINLACLSLIGATSEKGIVLQDPDLTDRLQKTYLPMLAKKLKALLES